MIVNSVMKVLSHLIAHYLLRSYLFQIERKTLFHHIKESDKHIISVPAK